ncbi:tripartite tricarboxylate transporter substrate binding protein [Rhodovarius crocodyli]|uniref:Tripartite tricarboxylate transporter substrate binding protein n=1 Tax=Rhodovarius crocodyli TaxID=1979269 RepID=A0A437LX65_9PROT|nr:tripartite tricarboxylate transporter substrate binding protein [Rhodovarius crocodyli]RVT89998.1 tripartite tricarboxylate transporter substrate binding protein [Rhodovarius crocodyli]
MRRRVFLASTVATPAIAQTRWPERPLRLIVPFPPGGASDLLGRLMAERLSARLGQPVVVENRGGAGGRTAAEYVAREPGDGYTLMLGTQPTHVFNRYLYSNLSYNPDRDFTALSTLAAFPYCLIVSPSLPARNLTELVAYAKANPGKLNYGSSGIGGGTHLATTLFAQVTGTELMHVPYRGAAAAVTAVMQGEVQVMVELVSNCLPQLQAGHVRGLAVGLPEPSPLLPGVPTFRSFGITDFDVPSWFIIVAAGRVPPAIAERLRVACDEAVRDPSFAERLAATTAQPMPISGQALTDFLADQNQRWAGIIRGANVRLD